MDCLFGLVGDGFALLVADSSAVQSIVVQKTDEDKIMALDSHKLLGNTGETGDRVQFSEYIQKNIHLYQFRNGIQLSTAAAANFTRACGRSPYQTNLMLAGFDKGVGPSLYFLDYISTLHKIEKGAMGYGGFFVLSMMDKYYKKGMSLDDALALVDKCIEEIRSRLVVAPPNFIIKVVDKDGARFLGWRKSVGDSAATSTVNEGPAVAVETSA
eukprot:SM000030S11353  [mRNA]  locus=s30:205605:207470:- [translate_table: standard]